MRASRLLHLLLLLQNRGRMTSADLARELEVTRRTILRDVDALTEAGLPIIVHQGNRGGIELGFNYRTRLTGLAADEAEAMAMILARPMPELAALGMAEAGARARNKMLESFPDTVREKMASACSRFRYAPLESAPCDARVAAIAEAIRRRAIVRINANTPRVRIVHPIALILRDQEWFLIEEQDPSQPIPLPDCGAVNISARTF